MRHWSFLGAFSCVQIGRIRSALLGVTSATRVRRLFAGGRSNLSLVFVGTERLIQEQSCTCYEKAYNPLIADLRSCYSDPQRTYPRTWLVELRASHSKTSIGIPIYSSFSKPLRQCANPRYRTTLLRQSFAKYCLATEGNLDIERRTSTSKSLPTLDTRKNRGRPVF